MRTIPVKKAAKKAIKQRHKEMYSPAASDLLLLSVFTLPQLDNVH